MTRTPRTPRTLLTLVLAALGVVAIGAAGWAFGLEWPPALLVALTVVVVLGLRLVPDTNSAEAWPAPPDDHADHGVRREVTRLSWSLHGYESRVERPSLVRLRALAERRLGWRGLDLGDPAAAERCRELLGPQAYRVITGDRRTEVKFEEFAATLDVLDGLGDARSRP